MYYHFWSSVVLTIVGIWGYEVIYQVIHRGSRPFLYPYGILVILMIAESFIGVVIAMSSSGHGVNLFSVPLSDFCCFNKINVEWGGHG